MQFHFNQDVGVSLDADDFSVTGLGGAVPFMLTYNNVLDTATLSFAGILADGSYTARAYALGITNASGVHLTSDGSVNFSLLNADANRDGVVDFPDLLVLAQNYGQTGRSFSQGDLNYDGTVGFDDLLLLSQRYGQSLLASAVRDKVPQASYVCRDTVIVDIGL